MGRKVAVPVVGSCGGSWGSVAMMGSGTLGVGTGGVGTLGVGAGVGATVGGVAVTAGVGAAGGAVARRRSWAIWT